MIGRIPLRTVCNYRRGGLFLLLILHFVSCVHLDSSIEGEYVTQMPIQGDKMLNFRLELNKDGSALLSIDDPLGKIDSKKISANWFLQKDGIIVLHYPTKTPIDYIRKDKQGNLHILTHKKESYQGKWADYNTFVRVR